MPPTRSRSSKRPAQKWEEECSRPPWKTGRLHRSGNENVVGRLGRLDDCNHARSRKSVLRQALHCNLSNEKRKAHLSEACQEESLWLGALNSLIQTSGMLVCFTGRRFTKQASCLFGYATVGSICKFVWVRIDVWISICNHCGQA